MIYIYISIYKTKTSFLSQKRAITTFLLRKFMITRLLIAFEDLLGSSIAPQVMPHWLIDRTSVAHRAFSIVELQKNPATRSVCVSAPNFDND